MNYDSAFRSQLQRLEEIGAEISGVTKAFWFLEKAGLSSDLRKQVVAAAGGDYNYTKLRAALVAIVPQVLKIEEETGGSRQWRRSNNGSGPPKQVHAVEDTEDHERN